MISLRTFVQFYFADERRMPSVCCSPAQEKLLSVLLLVSRVCAMSSLSRSPNIFIVQKLFAQVYSASPGKLHIGDAWPYFILPTILISFLTLISGQESERGSETCLCCKWHSKVAEPRSQEPKRKPMFLTSEPHCYPTMSTWTQRTDPTVTTLFTYSAPILLMQKPACRKVPSF